MRRMTWAAAIILSFSLLLSACGTKDAESVVKELDKFINNMESYQGSGTMTLHTGQQPLKYQVEVSYQKPEHYRIKLTNEEKDITQIVLRNDDGVFVLTPKLNKVFRFQSDWPQNQGQVYLYQTLIQSILIDGSRQFTVNEDTYVFDVMATYNNGSLARQKIWLNKSDYKPVQVEVSDTNAVVMVDVKFDSFEFGPNFDKSVFDTEANMQSGAASSKGEQPTAATPEDDDDAVVPNEGTDDSGKAEDDGAVDGNASDDGEADDDVMTDDDATGAAGNGVASEFIAMGAFYLPTGVVMKDSFDIEYGGQPGLMTRFDGLYSYTLIQTQPKDQAASLVPGMMVDLGFTMGELTTGDELKTLLWTYNGNQFRLTSANLPDSEMRKIAQSVQGEIDK